MQLQANDVRQGAIEMIELYSWYTSNGRKVSIALEELGIPYEVHPIDITRGEQTAVEFTRVSPNGKIPAIVDRDAGGRTLMESGAILLYLADKIGRLISTDEDQRWRTIEWLMWQMRRHWSVPWAASPLHPLQAGRVRLRKRTICQ